MSRRANRDKLLQFLDGIRKPECPLESLSDQDNLVEAGLIDSLALLEIVMHLEQEHGLDFRERGVDPGELASVESILDLIDGAGR